MYTHVIDGTYNVNTLYRLTIYGLNISSKSDYQSVASGPPGLWTLNYVVFKLVLVEKKALRQQTFLEKKTPEFICK